MPKNLLLIFVLIPFFVFSQNVESARKQAETYYENGDFLKSYQTLNTIKDKEVLENTSVNLFKSHLENIINHRFFKVKKLNDSLSKVYIKTSILKSQGVYNEKTKQYTLLPVYDSVNVAKEYYKYANIYKNNMEGFANIETGKVIVPLGNYICASDGTYVYVDTKSKYGTFSLNDLITVYDTNGNLLLKDMDTFNFMYLPNYISTKNKNNKYQIIDIKSNKIILDDCDYFETPINAIVENGISYDNIWLPFRKNNQNYLYKITADAIVDTHKFDTYVSMYSNYNHFDNALKEIINLKDNAPFRFDTIRPLRFYSDYTIVKKGDKYGIFNVSKDKFYKEPVYNSITKIGNTFYNGKWINLIYGEEICMPTSDKPEGIVFKKNNLFGLMDVSVAIVVEADYDEVKYLTNSIFILRKGIKWGFKGVLKDDKLVAPEFDYIEYRAWNFGYVGGYKNKKMVYFLRNGDKIDLKEIEKQKKRSYKFIQPANPMSSVNISKEFDRTIFETGGKYGLEDFNSREILAPKYDNIEYARKNKFIVSSGSLFGLMDRNGKEIVPVQYKKIEFKDSNPDLYFITGDNGLKSIFTSDGAMIYPPKIKEIANDYFDETTKADYFVVTEELSSSSKKANQNQEQEILKNGVIRVKDGKAERLDMDGTSFQIVNSIIIAGKIERPGWASFYSIIKEKLMPDQFIADYINDYNNQKIFARKKHSYDTVIDKFGNETTLEHPFNYIINDYFFFVEDDKIGVMNKDFKTANFRYPVLKVIDKKEYQFLSTYPQEYTIKAASYFKFNINKNSIKYGIVNFDGRVLFQPEIYDEITFFDFRNTSDNRNYGENEFLKKHENDLFICTTNKKDSKIIQFFNGKNENLATFEVKQNWSWNFHPRKEIVVIKSADSVQLYDLKTKKIDFKIKANVFIEDYDDGYTVSNSEPKATEIKYVKYDYKGNFMFDYRITQGQRFTGNFAENYILKRNNKYGTMNSKGKAGIPFVYDELESKKGKLFITKNHNLFGIVDEDGQTVVDKKYQEIKWLEVTLPNSGNTIMFSGYSVIENNKYGLLDANSKTLLPAVFDKIDVSSGNILGKKDSKVSVYDLKGKEIYSRIVDSVSFDSYNNYQFYKKGKKLILNPDGSIKDPSEYIPWEDHFKIKNSKLIDGKYYLVKNDTIIYKTSIDSIKEVVVNIDFMGEELKYFLIKDENGLCGLYTKDLKVILPFEYNAIDIAAGGDFYIVSKGGKFGVIDSESQIIIPFKYDEIKFDRRTFFSCKKNNKIENITPQKVKIYVEKKRKEKKMKSKVLY